MSQSIRAMKGARSIYFRIAACSGASAIAMKAFGVQAIPPSKDEYQTRLSIFTGVNQIHLLNSMTLLAVPLCNHPAVTGAFFVAGMSLVCGTGYYVSIKSPNPLMGVFQLFTPIGFLCLIFGWISMCL